MEKRLLECNKKRMLYVDLFKCLAIFFVLVYHCTTYSYDIIQDGSTVKYMRYLVRGVLSTCVPAFFFVNGYLLLNMAFSLEKHIKKTVRFILLTFIWATICLTLTAFITHKSIHVVYLLKNIIFLEGDGINHFWYMKSLICIYMVFPILKTTYDHDRKSFLYFTLICAILTMGNTLVCNLMTLVYKYILGKNIIFSVNLFGDFNLLRGIRGYSFVYFCCGGLFYNKVNGIIEKHNKMNVIAMISIIVSTAGLFLWGVIRSRISGEMWDSVFQGYDSIFTFVNTIAIFILCLNFKTKISGIKNIVRVISSNTLGVYFVHEILKSATRDYLMANTLFCNLLVTVFYAIALLGISLAITLAIKKVPYIKNIL